MTNKEENTRKLVPKYIELYCIYYSQYTRDDATGTNHALESKPKLYNRLQSATMHGSVEALFIYIYIKYRIVEAV